MKMRMGRFGRPGHWRIGGWFVWWRRPLKPCWWLRPVHRNCGEHLLDTEDGWTLALGFFVVDVSRVTAWEMDDEARALLDEEMKP